MIANFRFYCAATYNALPRQSIRKGAILNMQPISCIYPEP